MTLFRGFWVLPIFLTLFPIAESQELPRSLLKTHIHVLLDDSDSMKSFHPEIILEKIQSLCLKNSCDVELRKLSQENEWTKKSYTPLRQGLETWFPKVRFDPWILVSDGGDSTPTLPWPREWKGFGQDSEKKTQGILISFPDTEEERLWIEEATSSPLFFDGKPALIDVVLNRKRKKLNSETVQVQVLNGKNVLISENILFPEGQSAVVASLTLPNLTLGKQNLEVRVLAPPGEKYLWDKVLYVSSEVVSNTLGILHLLGSPNWDGRFMRRFLKSEPKYDLISFFILRDPWDVQAVSERELSLIPFPVARLFNEELPKFRSIVLQNFNLQQFLSFEYQKRLVDYVKAGGSLFFIGGPRSLLAGDLQNSPLRELFPFTLKTELVSTFNFWDPSHSVVDKNGPWFDKDLTFKMELASPSADKMALADVYEEWVLQADAIEGDIPWKGLHHMENVNFIAEHTPLILAKTADGKSIPLAVASYPEKGRAIWFFSDQLWRFAMSPSDDVSRAVYNRMIESSFSWLLRQDFRKPVTLSQFILQSWGEGERVTWSVDLEGPAIKYFETSRKWHLNVCDRVVDLKQLGISKLGASHLTLTGKLDMKNSINKQCTLSLTGQHEAFGSVKESILGYIPDMLKDQNVGGSELKMRQLSELTNAPLFSVNEFDKTVQFIETWLAEKTEHQPGLSIPPRFRSYLNYYWIFGQWWFYFLMIFLPLEVLVRRWPKLRP